MRRSATGLLFPPSVIRAWFFHIESDAGNVSSIRRQSLFECFCYLA